MSSDFVFRARVGTAVSTFRSHYTPFRRYDDYHGPSGLYALVDPRSDSLFYVGKASDLRSRIDIHFGLRAPGPGECGSPDRVQEVIASVRKDGLQPHALRVLRCPERALDGEERRAIGLGQALDGLVNWHAGGRIYDCDDWYENRGLLPLGDHEATLQLVCVDARQRVTFLYERGSDFYYNKVPTDDVKWRKLNEARVRWNVGKAMGVDSMSLSYADALSFARSCPRPSLPVTVRVVEHAVNRAGQRYRRYDIVHAQACPMPVNDILACDDIRPNATKGAEAPVALSIA